MAFVKWQIANHGSSLGCIAIEFPLMILYPDCWASVKRGRVRASRIQPSVPNRNVERRARRLCQSQGLAFFVNELQVMRDVSGCTGQQLLQRKGAALGVNADAFEDGIGLFAKDAGELAACYFNDGTLFRQIALVI